ncbi:MAG: CBS domain-containing protein [bacterium]
MLQQGIGCLPVVDGTALVGIVTKTDLLRGPGQGYRPTAHN